MSGESRLYVFQEPFPGTFNKQEIVSGTAKLILSLIFDEFGVDILILIFIVEAGIESLGLTNRLQILSQLPSLEDRLDPADEGRDLSPEVGSLSAASGSSRNFSPMRYLSALSVPNSSSIILAASHF